MRVFLFLLLLLSNYCFATEEFDQRILTDPQFQPLFQECEKVVEENKKKQPLPTPDGTVENSIDLANCTKIQFDKLPESTREKMANKYYRINKGKKVVRYQKISPHSYEKKLSRSAAYKKLLEYLKKRLAEALYGNDPQKRKGVDHGVFYDLYKNQLSKNIILTFSSFCLEAQVMGSTFVIHKDDAQREATRINNMKNLGQFDPNDKSNMEQKRWLACIAAVDDLCKGKIAVSCSPNDSTCSEDKKYTKNRACITTHTLKQEKEALSATLHIQQKLDARNKRPHKGIWNTDISPKKSTDELSTITSGELEKNYTSELEAEKKKLEECKKQNPPDKQCLKILKAYVQDEKDLEKMDAEQQLLADKKIEEMQNNNTEDPDAIIKAKRNILAERDIMDEKERKKAEEELDKLKDKNIQDIEQEITQSYKNEADAIKQQIQDALKTARASKQQQLDQTANRLGKTAVEKKQLIHYNNIVSGFLELSPLKDKGKKRKNTASIQRELADSAFQKKRDPASTDNNGSSTNYQLADIEEKIRKNTDIKAPSGGDKQGSVGINVQKINDLLHLNGRDRTPSSSTNQPTNQQNRK